MVRARILNLPNSVLKDTGRVVDGSVVYEDFIETDRDLLKESQKCMFPRARERVQTLRNKNLIRKIQ